MVALMCRFAGPKSARSTDGHMPVVHFVTSNKQKLREVQALLAEGKLDVPFRLEALDVTLPELQDDPTVVRAWVGQSDWVLLVVC